MKKIIISGANGFVGSSLAEDLAKDYLVTCLVRKNADITFVPENTSVEPVDYSDKNKLEKIFEGKSIFIHCAAATKADSWEKMKAANVDLTENLLDITNRTESIEQFIFLSSQAAAGPSESKPKTEDDLCNPISWYGKSKLEAETVIKTKSKKNFTIIRPSSVYGPKDKDFLLYFKLIKYHLAFKIGFSESKIALIYINELIKIIRLTILNPKSYNEIFFAAENNYTIDEFIKTTQRAMQVKALKVTVPEVIPDLVSAFAEIFAKFNKKTPLLNKEKVKEIKIKNWTVSNEKAKRILGYSPDTNLLTHLTETYKWYKENGWL